MVTCYHDYITGHKVCVVDAAVLLPAQWDRYTNEVWALVLSPREVSVF